jgi:carbamoylphosphate synthase large subunit
MNLIGNYLLKENEMKTLILGDYGFNEIQELLTEKYKEISVIGIKKKPQNLPEKFKWYEYDQFNADSKIIELIKEFKPNLIISRTLGTVNEFDILRYSRIKEKLEKSFSINFLIHNYEFAKLVNKVEFYNFAIKNKIFVPKTFLVQTINELEKLLDRGSINYPFIIKKPNSLSGKGTKLIKSYNDIKYLNFSELIVQEFLYGEEIGVEIYSTSKGSIIFPIISMDKLNYHVNPQTKLRIGPYNLEKQYSEYIYSIIKKVETLLKPVGNWQMDLAIANGKVYVLEINPRLGGLSHLSYSITGVNPHELDILQNSFNSIKQPPISNYSVEIPISEKNALRLNLNHNQLILKVMPARNQPNWRLSLTAKSMEVIKDYISNSPGDLFIESKENLLKKIDLKIEYGVGNYE